MFTWWFAKLENRKSLIARAIIAGIIAIISFVAFIVLIVLLISTEEMILILFLCIEFIFWILFMVRTLCDISKLMKPNINVGKSQHKDFIMEKSVSGLENHTVPAITFSNYLINHKYRLEGRTIYDCNFELQTIMDWEKMTEAELQKNIKAICEKYSKTKYYFVLTLYRDYLRE